MDKVFAGKILSENANNYRIRPKLTIADQVSYMKDMKGIKFNIVAEHEAEEFLRDSSYYFKVKAFEKNYTLCNSGENSGKYYNLEFAYLQELSTLDMYLREIVLSMSLDIEHYLKVKLLRDISEDEQEDGYALVNNFFEIRPNVKVEIEKKAGNSYCEKLIQKYKNNFAVWNVVEILSFGDLIELCALYYDKQENPKIVVGNYRIVKFLRNAAAHNNCLINDLANNSENTFNQNRQANSFVSQIKGISSRVQTKKMGNRFMHDFVVMLYCFYNIVSSEGVRKHQLIKLKKLLDERFVLHKEYFVGNQLLLSNYDFAKKVVDRFAEMCI